MKLLKGKEVADTLKKRIAKEVDNMTAKGQRRPYLVAVLVGNDGASVTYVGNKETACKVVGFDSKIIHLDDSTTEKQLLEVVQELNNDEAVDGFIVQLPLPKHINEDNIITAISPEKDVDGFHPINIGRTILGMDNALVSATPLGITELLRFYDIETRGKECVVVGRSNIVGRPISNLLSNKDVTGNATVTLCHSRTRNLAEVVRRGDIVIVAMGQQEFITADMIKEGAVVVDVGMHRIPDATRVKGFRLVGDVKFDEVAPKCSLITPVPGGVGPLTIVSLMLNTLKAAKFRR